MSEMSGSRATSRVNALVAVIGLAICLLLIGLHVLAVREGPHWTSPLLLGDHLFDLLFALVVFLYAMALGRRLCKPWRALAGDPFSDQLAVLGMGLGLLSLLILGFGFLHLYYPATFLAIGVLGTWWLRADLAAILSGCADATVHWMRGGLPIATTRARRLTVVVLGIAFALLWLDSTLPAGSGVVMEWDAATYHLPEGQLFIQAHHVIPLPDLPFANAPSGVEMFYLVGLLGHADGLGKTLNLLFTILLCAATFALARRHGHPGAGWLAVILLANVNWVLTEVPATINDFAGAALLVLGVNDVLVWLEQWTEGTSSGRRGIHLLLRAGCLFGFSASFKLSNLPIAPAAVIALGLCVLVMGRRSIWERLIAAVTGGVLMGTATLLALSPWIIKSYVYFGHPFYPLSVAPIGPGGTMGGTPTATDQIWSAISNLTQVFSGAFGALGALLLLAPLLLRTAGARGAQVMLLIGGAFWIRYVPLFAEPRYYIPLIALGAAIAAAVISRIIDYLPFRSEWAELPFVAYLLLHSLLILSLSAQQAIDSRAGQVAIGQISPATFLGTHIEPYVAEDWINTHTPMSAVIAVVNSAQGYYLDRTYLSNWYNERLTRLNEGGRIEADEFASWCRSGARYLLLSRGADTNGSFNEPQRFDLHWLHLPGLHATLRFTANNVDVYTVTPCFSAKRSATP